MEPQSSNELHKINVNKIVEAGKALKNVVYAVLIMILSSVIGVLIAISSSQNDKMTFVYVFIGLVSLVCNIIILLQLYSAGESLEKVQPNQQAIEINHLSPIQTPAGEYLEKLPSNQLESDQSSLKQKTDKITDENIFDKLEIFKNDFPNQMTWDEALNSCKEMGNDWRLPTLNELIVLYKKRDLIGNFDQEFYWSSKKGLIFGAWLVSFRDGNNDNISKERKCNVRAVRSI